MTTPELVTPREAASALRVCPNSIYGWCRTGQLRSVRLGGLWRIARTDLDAVIAGGFPTPDTAPAEPTVRDSVEQPMALSRQPAAKPGPHPNAGWR